MVDSTPEYRNRDHLEESLSSLVDALARLEGVRAIGLSGDLQNLPEPGLGDLDIFLYCTVIPDANQRRTVLDALGKRVTEISMNRLIEGRWGQADCLLLDGVETWLMYFTIEEAQEEVEAVMAGQALDREGDFYPTGRPAMYLKMTALYDPDRTLASFRERVIDYPQELSQAILGYHLAQLEDTEDLDRAAEREDLLFYHFALDRALDHYLQALFALNRTYFPSRKRSLKYIRTFAHKPEHLESRLLDILGWSSNPETLSLASEAWLKLVDELKRI